MKKKYVFLFLIVAAFGFAIVVNYAAFPPYGRLLGNVSAINSPNQQELQHQLKNLYTLTFKLDKAPIGTVNTYLPKYKAVDLDGALYYFSTFGLDVSEAVIAERITETDDFFSYANEQGTTNVYKFSNTIHFIAKQKTASSVQLLTEEDAVLKAVQFIERKFLYLGYEETEVTLDENGCTLVQFISRIGNIRNYAFTTRVTLNQQADVIEMVYNYMNYEKFVSNKIQSMESAFSQLPIEALDAVAPIELTSCTLVYVYENSIVQPAYLFEGNTSVGGTFQSFIKAAQFE